MKNKILLISSMITILAIATSCSGGTDTSKNNLGASPGASPKSTETAKNPQIVEGEKKLSTGTIDEKYIMELMAKNKAAQGISYEIVTKVMGKETRVKVWTKGEKSKQVMNLNNVDQVTITEGDYVTTYDLGTKTGSRYNTKLIGTEDTEDEKDITENPMDDMKKQGFKYLETAEYDGQKCYIVTFEQKTEKMKTRAWVSEKFGMVVKMEAKGDGNMDMLTEFKNINMENINDDVFKVPSDIKIQEIKP